MGRQQGTSLLDNVLTIEEYVYLLIEKNCDYKIASDLYVGVRTLHKWKAKMGITRQYVNQKRYEMIMDMRNKGLSYSQVAQALNLSKNRIFKIKKQFENERALESIG